MSGVRKKPGVGIGCEGAVIDPKGAITGNIDPHRPTLLRQAGIVTELYHRKLSGLVLAPLFSGIIGIFGINGINDHGCLERGNRDHTLGRQPTAGVG